MNLSEKDKAVELTYWYYHKIEKTLNKLYDDHAWDLSKKLATKVVEELISETGATYWYKVKHQIEKL